MEQLKNAVKITVKREAATRWSAKAEAVKGISEGVTELVELFESLLDDISQTMDTRNEAGTLFQNIMKSNFIVLYLLHFWNSRPRSKTTTRPHNELKMQHPIWKCWKIFSKNFVIICAKMQLSIARADVTGPPSNFFFFN